MFEKYLSIYIGRYLHTICTDLQCGAAVLVPGVLQRMVLTRVRGHDLAALPGLDPAPRAAARRHHDLGSRGLRVLAH